MRVHFFFLSEKSEIKLPELSESEILTLPIQSHMRKEWLSKEILREPGEERFLKRTGDY